MSGEVSCILNATSPVMAKQKLAFDDEDSPSTKKSRVNVVCSTEKPLCCHAETQTWEPHESDDEPLFPPMCRNLYLRPDALDTDDSNEHRGNDGDEESEHDEGVVEKAAVSSDPLNDEDVHKLSTQFKRNVRCLMGVRHVALGWMGKRMAPHIIRRPWIPLRHSLLGICIMMTMLQWISSSCPKMM